MKINRTLYLFVAVTNASSPSWAQHGTGKGPFKGVSRQVHG